MNGQNPAIVRALYIVLIPVVLLIILLNSGFLQRHLPAAKVGGRTLSAVEYNFYYFDFYNDFLEEHEDELSQMGYDTGIAASKQQYTDDMTWQEYFLSEAEEEMSKSVYYHELAEEAGYEFSDDELLLYENQMEKNDGIMSTYGLSESNFYVSYYGRGMTKAIYEKELRYMAEGYSYMVYLENNYTASDDKIEEYLENNDLGEDYKSVNFLVISIAPVTDRTTGEAEDEQFEALKEKLYAIKKRYEEGVSFDELYEKYSDEYADTMGADKGRISEACDYNLPIALQDEYLYCDQESLSQSDIIICIDEDTNEGFFTIFEGFGESGLKKTANLLCGLEEITSAANEAIKSSYAVNRIQPGIHFVAN